MRRRIHFLLSASLGLAVIVLLSPAGFAVRAWLAPLAESRFAYDHPAAATAGAALLPWLAAGIIVHWFRPLLRLPGIFALVAWTGIAVPVTAITIRDAGALHEWPGMVVGREQMRTPPARAADAALAAGDCRPLAISGFGPVVPVVGELAQPQREGFGKLGQKYIYGTSDVVLSPVDERYRARAYRYAERYNRRLLAGLRMPAGALDWSRCRTDLSPSPI